MTDMVKYAPALSVRHRVDVCVVGGGPAGITAAVAAGRMGMDVFLVEQTGCLGGMGTSGLVPGFCAYSDNEHVLASGLGVEVVDRLQEQDGMMVPEKMTVDKPEMWGGILPFKAEVLKRVYDDMVLEASVTLRFATMFVDVIREDGKVTHAVFAGKEGMYAVAADIFIDATGDGQLCWLAGAETETGGGNGETQGMTLCSMYACVDPEKRDTSQLTESLNAAFENGEFREADLHHPGVWITGKRLGGANVGHVYGSCGVVDEELSDAYVEGRRLAAEYERFYRKHIPGFENIELCVTGSLMGVRETRRVLGEYVLNLEDFTSRASFDDEIGRYNYPIDIHRSNNSTEDYAEFEDEFRTRLRLNRGESYGIPYRSLLPVGLENVLVAGRCISTDRWMQGSIRVMPCCFLMGQAAGVSAAMSVSGDTALRGVDTDALRGKLRDMGTYLP